MKSYRLGFAVVRFLVEANEEPFSGSQLMSADSTLVDLDSLQALFFDDPQLLGKFSKVEADQVVALGKELLNHNSHMTVAVEQYHGCNVDVDVLEHRTDGDHYSRKILLRRQSDNCVVMYGIVRLHLTAVSDLVREEIESRKIPLGRVLINHNVLREVQLLSLYRIECGGELAEAFGCNVGDVCFGRTAIIHCDGKPAIELLEIVGC